MALIDPRVLGFLYDEPDEPLPEKLEAFLSAGPPPIYLGFGSMTDPSPESSTREVVALSEALGTLSDGQRAVLTAKVQDGRTFSEIADEMRIAVPTAKTHYLRALRTMRDRLRKHDDH